MKGSETKSCHHASFAWMIAVLLGFILIALVFKIGLIIGGSHSGCSTYGANDYHKNFSTHYDYKKKAVSVDVYKIKAAAMGMTIAEYKTYLVKQKKDEYTAFEAKSKANGMTMEEYKQYLAEQKK